MKSVVLLACFAMVAIFLTPAPSAAAAQPTGQAGFVRGAYGKDSSPSGSDLIAGLGFNTVMTSPYRQLLDPLAVKGLRGIVWLGNYINAPTCNFERDDSTVRSQVAAVAGHPAILAYFLGDEPKVSECAAAPAMFKKRSELVHALDPGSQTFTVIQQSEHGVLRRYAPWAGAVDIIGFDVYPCNVASSTCNFGAIDAAIESIEKAGIKRYWAVMQDFQDCYYRLPTPQELATEFDHWGRSSMSGYLVFSWKYQSRDPKCVGTSLENHPQNIARLREENSRTFSPTSSQSPPPSLSLLVPTVGGTSVNALAGAALAGAVLVGVAGVAVRLRSRRVRNRKP